MVVSLTLNCPSPTMVAAGFGMLLNIICSLWLIFLLVSFFLPGPTILGQRWCLWEWVLFCGVVFLIFFFPNLLIWSSFPNFPILSVNLSWALRLRPFLEIVLVYSVSVGSGLLSFEDFYCFLYFCVFLGSIEDSYGYIFGLVSSAIHLVSRSWYSSAMLPSFACWTIAFLIRIPSPSPFLFLFLAVNLHPLMLICWFLSSFVPVTMASGIPATLHVRVPITKATTCDENLIFLHKHNCHFIDREKSPHSWCS